MKQLFFFLTMLLYGLFLFAQGKITERKTNGSKDIVVACYYFPNYHTRDKSDLRISNQHWEDWSEWELVKQAKPRFEGHHQPNVPAWDILMKRIQK